MADPANYARGTLAGAAPTAKTPNNAAQEILERLNSIHADMSMNVDRTQRVIDRAFGADAKGEGPSGQPRAVPSGEIGAIMQRIEDIVGLVVEQSNKISRLDKLV